MLNISDAQKKVLSIWLIVGVVIFIVVIFIALLIPKNEANEKEELTAKDSNKLIDRSRYYTVKGAITKYYSYLNMKDYKAVLEILDDAYITKENITEDTLTKLYADTASKSYQSKVMCLESVDKGIYKFVVEGEEIEANTGKILENKYYSITLNGNNSLFNLSPIDQTLYNEVCNGKN